MLRTGVSIPITHLFLWRARAENVQLRSLRLMNEHRERNEGTPENATKLKQQFLNHDCLLIASPERKSSITPLMKNTSDWVSRPAKGESRLAAYQGKVGVLMAA